MFHFLKNTTMLPDFMAHKAIVDSIVISNFDDYNYVYPYDILQNHIHCEQKYKTAEQWFATFDDDVQFLNWMYDTMRNGVVIYADTTAYAKIVCKWLSFVCSKLTVEQAYQVYRLSMLWFYVYQVHLHMRDPQSLLVEYADLIDHYKIVDYQQFTTYYESNRIRLTDQVLAIKEKVKNYISNEFKYAFYLNGDASFEPMVDEHVNKALVRCFKLELEQYKTVSLFDAVYESNVSSVDQIKGELFDILKQSSKTLPNDTAIEPSIERLYQYGATNSAQLMTYNNVLIDQYHDILSSGKTLKDKIDFMMNIVGDGVAKSEFVDCFMSSYDLYNLMTVRWIMTLYREKSTGLKNFVY